MIISMDYFEYNNSVIAVKILWQPCWNNDVNMSPIIKLLFLTF